MPGADRPLRLARFESFELDVCAGELRRLGGAPVFLREQSLRILILLLEHPGEVVQREEIRKKLWPNDTIVEFEHSISAAINRLRQALGDSADNPKYVETLARRGYRWMVAVEWAEGSPALQPVAVAEKKTAEPSNGRLIGRKVSHYRVLQILGGGGMGVVYEAEDLRLGRRVALKFLPEELTSDPGALQRFESEARSASALNHPNICTIYEVEEYEGRPFLVMELLEGQTLRDLIATIAPGNAPLDLTKLLDLAVQITAGLEAAHRQGIVHRDIKPANIFITSHGQAKILDFGLAKLFLIGTASVDSPTTDPPEEGSPYQLKHEAESLTASSPFLSRTGVAMGTAGYMSPEQVRGEKLDARTDLFSFGLVLYEMATGRRAFAGDTASVLHDTILNRAQSPARDLNPELPPKLEKIIGRALIKDREARYQSASEMRAGLENLKREVEPRRRPRWRTMAAVGVVVLFIATTGLWIRHRDAKPSEPEFQRLSFGRGMIRSARFAPDGQSVVYGAAWDGKPSQLFWTKAGSFESRPLGVEADILAISPTGEMAVLLNQRFGMVASQGTLSLMSLTGSAPRKLLDNVQDADWSPDGSELVVTHYVGSGRCDLEFPPGKVLYETTGGAWLSHPRVSPGGDRIAFLEHPVEGDDVGFLEILDLAGNKKILSLEFTGIQGLAWDPVGDAIWFSGSEPGPFGPRALFKITTAGDQRLVLRESGNLTLHDVSREGHLALTRDTLRAEVFGRIASENKERELTWLDYSLATDLSDDGSTIVLSVQGEASATGYAVYVRKTDGSPAVRLGDGFPSQFSPDGKWVLTTSRPSSTSPQLFLLPTGAGQPVTLTHDSLSHYFATLLPDGKTFLFEGKEPGHARRNWVQSVTRGKPMPITPEGTVGHQVSPDGKLLVAVDLERRFWLYPIGGGQPRALLGIEPGEDTIRWSGDGKYLFVAGDGIPASIYRVEVLTGRRQLVYKLAPSDPAGLWNFLAVLITPDGKSYVYSDYRILSDLYLANGLR
jgi:eukaryotic-like serine/threonine-protein kinase